MNNNNIKSLICEHCKAPGLVKISENEYQCKFCGTTNIIGSNPSGDYIEYKDAYILLYKGEFSDAEDSFTNLLNRNPKYYDALWGKLLAHYGITIEHDPENGKSIPTLHDWIEDNILENDIYKKLISKVDKCKRDIYVSLANKIEEIREEVFEKYKNEEEYDIFISFKWKEEYDKTKETKDFYEASKLHSSLLNKYRDKRIFFSPVTMQNEVGKNYEPIVFHALRTAKILIVYGQKAEHFEATWVKNEWSRYLELVKNEKKLEGSCIVCIENMNAYDLPKKLNMKQVIDFTNNKNAYATIYDTVERILSEYDKKYNHVKTVNIEYKQIKSNGNLPKNDIKRYDFNSSNVTIETDDVIRTLNLANEKLKSQEYNRAKKLFEKVLKENQNNAQALLGKILSDNKINSLDNIKVIASNIDTIDKAIKNSIKEDAINVFLNPITDSLKKYIDKFNLDEDSYKVYKCLINIEYERSTELNDFILDKCIKNAFYDKFKEAIRYVDNEDVDKHVKLRELMQTSLVKRKKYDLASKLIDETLRIKEGTNQSLYNKLLCHIGDDLIVSKMDEEGFKLLDDLLSYTQTETERDLFLGKFYKKVSEQIITANTAKLVKELLGRIANKDLWATISLEIAEKLKNNNFFKEAKEFYEIFLQNSSENKDKGYAGILLCKYNCKTFDELVNQDKDFTDEKELDILQSLPIDEKLHNYYFNLDKKWIKIQDEKKSLKRAKRNKAIKTLIALVLILAIWSKIYTDDYSNGEWILSGYDEILSDGTIEGGVLDRKLFGGLYVQKIELSEIIKKYEVITIKEKPKCESMGIYYFDVDKYTSIYFTVPKLGHNYTDWEVVTYPTETENGLMQRTCKNDSSHIETKVMPKLTSDEYTDVSLTYYSACEEIRKYGLNVEGVKVSFDITTVTGGHNFTKWKLVNAPTETEPGLIERTCLNDNSHVESVEIPELSTSVYEIDVLKVASCNQKGLNKYTYYYDNQEITIEINTPIDVENHKYSSWKLVNIPTEEKTGSIKRTCSNNRNHVESVEIPKLTSRAYEKEILKEATCAEEGLCKYTYNYESELITFNVNIPIDDNNHNYISWEIINFPTKENTGLIERKCLNNCESVERIELPVLSSSDYRKVFLSDATCTENGKIEYNYYDGFEEISFYVEIPKLNHNYEIWKFIEKPTETQTGLIEWTCLNDENHTKTETLPVLTSSEYHKVVGSETTCTEDGVTKYIYNNIGFDITTKAQGHNYSKWAVAVIPTESSTGLIKRTCLNDGNHTETKELPKLTSYKYKKQIISGASCEKAGKVSYTYTIDNENVAFTISTDIIGHNYSSWEIISKPTETQTGLIKRICQNDNSHIQTVTLPTLSSSVYNVEVLKKATCTEEGSKRYTYNKDDQVLTIDVATSILGHNYSKFSITKYPTDTEEGTIKIICNNDNDHFITEKLPILSSSLYDVKVETSATCTIDGINVYTYLLNGYSIAFDVKVPKLGHDYSEWSLYKTPTETETGLVKRTCLRDSNHVETYKIPETTANVYTYEVINEATCTETGLYKYRYYFNNDEITFNSYISKNVDNHNYSSWELITKPSLTNTGLIQRTCLRNSNHKETKVLPVLTSNDYKKEVINEMTCEDDGITKYIYNFDEYTINFNIISKTQGHDYPTEWSYFKSPTESTTGMAIKTCLNDKEHQYTVYLPILSSNEYEKVILKENTCEESGSIKYIYTINDDIFDFYGVTAPTGHNYKNYKCINCGNIRDYYIEGNYVYIGEYPQTVKDKNVTILNQIGQTNYYLGSDGEKYLKAKANPCDTNYTYTNGETVIKDNEYYFKVEPVKWQIIYNQNGRSLLSSVFILDAHAFGLPIDEYEDSDVKTYVSRKMSVLMFTDNQKNLIQDTDFGKLFLMSLDEVNITGSLMDKKVTDYAVANYAMYSTYAAYLRNGDYLLRTTWSYYAYAVNYEGDSENFVVKTLSKLGIAPGLWISLS